MQAYTHYSFFEWGLIFFDVLYDAIAEQEYKESDLQVCFEVSGLISLTSYVSSCAAIRLP